MGDTAEFSFTFSSPITLNSTRCFFDKLILVNTLSTSSEPSNRYQPLYPGLCLDTRSSNNIVAYLDPRDFRLSLNFFMTVDTINLMSVSGQEVNFLPYDSLFPLVEPLGARALQLNSDPRAFSFDIDFNRGRLLLHFSDYMDLSSLNASQLVLVDVVSGATHTLNTNSRPNRVRDEDHVRTICITMSVEDVEALHAGSICTTVADNCACYFSSSLVSSFSGVPVQDTPPSLPLPVRPQPVTNRPPFCNLCLHFCCSVGF